MKKLLLFALLASTFLLACQPKPVGGTLEKTNWILTSATQGKAVAAPGKNARITALFGKEKISGDGSCNSYSGGVKIDGVTIAITDISSTERMCDDIDHENSYLGLLLKAQSYSVLKKKLEIYCENGKLVFAPMSDDELTNASRGRQMEALEARFPQIEGGAMPHLYPVLKVDNPGDYPYRGTLVDTAFYQAFDDESHNIWSGSGGEVYAVGRYSDMYICRVPGRYVSSDVAIFMLHNGVLTRSETVAWAWCDEGWCNQQDAWLLDINRDGRMDIVQRYALRDDKGKLREERMTVLTQNENGTFSIDDNIKPDKSQFLMAKL